MKESFAPILALEVRRHRLGFAVIDKPERVLESGTGTYIAPRTILRFVDPLVMIFGPCVIVVRCARHINPRHRREVNATLRIIGLYAASQSIQVVRVTDDEIQATLNLSKGTKDEIAAAVARRFPELCWKLPRVRKPWTSEAYNTVMFDAVAAALVFLKRIEVASDLNESP